MTFAFSVASIVMFAPNDCALVLNSPPPLKLPLFSAAGVMLPPANSRKYTKILFVPLEGAALKVRVDPSGIV